MSADTKANSKQFAWLLCAALLGGLVGAAVVSKGSSQAATPHVESTVDEGDVTRLESEISFLKSRVRDLEDKAR